MYTGRPVNASRFAFTELRRAYPIGMLPQTPSPMSATIPYKRTYGFESSGYSSGRAIRPKPTSMGSGLEQTTQIDQPPHKKKRGRPSKADLQARSEGQPSSEAGPAPRPPPVEPASATLQARTASLPEAGSIDQPSPEETRPLPPVSRMPISSILTPTVQQSTSQSSSSSGKRRRGRSTRSEPEDLPSAGTSGARAGQEYESPYARMAGQVQDSPARAAVLRHREEQDPRPPPHFEPRQPSAQAPPPTTTASE